MARMYAALIRHGDYQQLADTPSAHQPFPLTGKGLVQAAELAPLIYQQCQQLDCQINPVVASSKLLRAWQIAMKMVADFNESTITIRERFEQ